MVPAGGQRRMMADSPARHWTLRAACVGVGVAVGVCQVSSNKLIPDHSLSCSSASRKWFPNHGGKMTASR